MTRPVIGFGRLADVIDAFERQTRFILDCQAVVALRMARLAAGGAPAVSESMRMVSEKVVTFTDAQIAAAAVLPFEGWPGAAVAATTRYRKAVSGNRRRLTRTSR